MFDHNLHLTSEYIIHAVQTCAEYIRTIKPELTELEAALIAATFLEQSPKLFEEVPAMKEALKDIADQTVIQRKSIEKNQQN